MARPLKKGLGYFPFDTDIMSDLKIQRLVLIHGCGGFSVYIVMLCDIYNSNGYYMPHEDELFCNVSFALKMPEKEVRSILATCVRLGLFDAKLLRDRRIYTSTGVQTRFYEISKRSKFQMDTGYLTDKMRKICAAETRVIAAKTPVSVTKTTVSAAKTRVSADINRNGNKNGKGKPNKNSLKNNSYEEDKNVDRSATTADNDALARRAELLRLAAEATGSRND